MVKKTLYLHQLVLSLVILSVIMPNMNTLIAKKRSKTDKLGVIRHNGMIPAVVYGAKVENTMLSVSSINFAKILREAGETSTITLEIVDEDSNPIKKVDALIHEIQNDSIKGFPLHIDFLAVDVNKPIEVTVPVEFIGVSPADKNNLGILVKALYEIEIEALPKDIPQKIEVDVSSLIDLDSQIRVKDIKIDNNVKVITNSEEIVALITPIQEEKEEAPVDISSVEVEKKGKKEEDTQEGEKKD
jgi:large subunit ribosomal protein L25